MYEPELEGHFEDLGKQKHAVRLGMWIFLASELLFFTALFTLYAYYRTRHPAIFHEAVPHNPILLGTLNTVILIGGSTCIALAVNLLRRGRSRAAAWLTVAAAGVGLAFLVVKAIEYGIHFDEGIYPGGRGHFFAEHPEDGWPIFFTLYFAMTGLHAIHVAVGAVLLGWLAWWQLRRKVGPEGAYRLEMGALYWHFVDTVWIFLWPMFYLMGKH